MTTILAFLFVLGVLIFVHELGHFLVARWHGVRVHTFSLGFGPKLVKFRRGDTEYCISAVPLGGYVKLAGETVEDARTGAPDEFLSKSKWVRFQVYLAGPIMNILLAIVVLAGVLAQGADVPTYEQSPPVIGHVEPGSPAEAAGLRPGDRVLTVQGRAVATWDQLLLEILPRAHQALKVTALRDGQTIELTVTPGSEGRYEVGEVGVRPVLRPEIRAVTAGSPAERAGFQPGDVIVAVAEEQQPSLERVIVRIQNSADAPISFVVERSGAPVSLTVTPEGAPGAALIGVNLSAYEVDEVDLNFFQALDMSVERNWENTLLIGRTLRGLVTRDTPVSQLMGPIGMADLSGTAAQAGLLSLFNLMAMISLNLGLLNLLPVPVLDGGHIAILAVEGLARRDLSMRVKERILMAGAAVIVLLMVTVIYNDIARLLR
jgi:regulator of sigma E protease